MEMSMRRHMAGLALAIALMSAGSKGGSAEGVEAEVRAALLLEKAQAPAEDMQRDIDGLKLKRRDVETSIEATILTLRSTLELVRDQDLRDRDEKVIFHRPRLLEAEARIG